MAGSDLYPTSGRHRAGRFFPLSRRVEISVALCSRTALETTPNSCRRGRAVVKDPVAVGKMAGYGTSGLYQLIQECFCEGKLLTLDSGVILRNGPKYKAGPVRLNNETGFISGGVDVRPSRV